jgi:hypothetical protein
MRSVLIVLAVLLLAGMAFGQATVIGGWATNLGWAGYYPAPPFVPVITTPSITFQSFSPTAGASNSMFGLTAGATNSTLSMVTPVNPAAYSAAVFANGPVISSAPVEAVAVSEHKPEKRKIVETGASTLLAPGVNEAVTTAKTNRKPATRTYTNQDVDRMNQNNGMVKWDGKTEKI